VVGRRNTGSQTRSASSMRFSTCNKVPMIRTAVGRDKFCCVSVDRSARAISRESIGTPKLGLTSHSWILRPNPRSLQYGQLPITKVHVLSLWKTQERNCRAPFLIRLATWGVRCTQGLQTLTGFCGRCRVGGELRFSTSSGFCDN
jgi:hypothetical protein